MHTARIWMALAIPGGAPGYDDDKQFGNFITHMAAHTSQRLRGYSRPTPEVKGGRHQTRFRQTNRVPSVRRAFFTVIPGWSEGPDLRCTIAHLRFARFTSAPE